MSTLLLVPLEDVVVFPNMNVTLPIDVGDEERRTCPKARGKTCSKTSAAPATAWI